MMGFVAGPLQVVELASPLAVLHGMLSPLVDGLPDELGTGPAPMHPKLLAAALHHGCDPRPALELARRAEAVPVRTQYGNQPRRHYRAGARQRVHDEKVGVRLKQSGRR